MKTYRAVRRLRIGDGWREPGELVPEAATWRLVESLVRAGEMEEVEVTAQELSVAITQHAPGESEQIYTALGVTPYDPGPPTPRRQPEAPGEAEVTQEPREVDPGPPPRPRRGRKEKAPILVEPPAPLEE